jgi:uncharacterized protein with FMN-binding domain
MPHCDGYMMTLKIKNYIEQNGLKNIPIVSYSSMELNEDEKCL